MRLPSSNLIGVSGIYFIVHIDSGKCYLGSTNDLYYRCNEHRTSLRRGDHHNVYLQNSWNKYGEDRFSFIVYRVCQSRICRIIEQFLICLFNPEYNIQTVVSDISMKKTTFSDEHRRKLSESNRRRNGKYHLSDDAKERISQSQKKRLSDPDMRQAVSDRAKEAWSKRRAKGTAKWGRNLAPGN